MAETSPNLGPEFIVQGNKAIARNSGFSDPGTSQVVAIGATATYSTQLATGQHYLLTSTVACFINESKDGTTAPTSTTDMYLPANTPRLLYMGHDTKNQVYTYFGVVQVSSSGSLYITPMSGI